MKFLTLFFGTALALLGQPVYADAFAQSAFEIPGAQTVDDIRTVVEREFERYDADYQAQRRKFASKLRSLRDQLHAAQRTGNAMACSTQLASEAKWLLNHTAHWAKLEATIHRLEASLAVADQGFALTQSPEDGAWGACYSEWFLKLDATIDVLNYLLTSGESPRYPLSFLERVGNADKLIHTMEELLVSDIAHTGIDRRNELSELVASMAQLLFKPQLKAYVDTYVRGFEISAKMVNRYRTFLDRWQSTNNGYWGAFYRVDAEIYRGHDLSITFHIISYQHGRVNHWSEIVDTTLAIKALEYPYGWLKHNAYNDHNSYDVSKIFRYGWPHMNATQRRRVSQEIGAMVDWFLRESVRGDGSLRSDPEFYSSLGDHYYFALSFLEVIGYWDPSNRFWTERGFPGARQLCHSFKKALSPLVHDSFPARAAMERLPADCTGVP